MAGTGPRLRSRGLRPGHTLPGRRSTTVQSRVQAPQAQRLGQREHHRRQSAAPDRPATGVVLPTHHRPAFRSLRRVVVHRHLGVLDEDRQAGPVVAQALQDLLPRRPYPSIYRRPVRKQWPSVRKPLGTGLRERLRSAAAIELLKGALEWVRNPAAVEELIAYLEKRRAYIPNYQQRQRAGLWIASTRVEKYNDWAVSARRKHQGMSWSPQGVLALAALEAARRNGELDAWRRDGALPERALPEPVRKAA